ncbi:MAG TPA: hypothetical protein VGS07_32215 [Thermoanaerobaculia bacterium]|jgi:hypothetical protein|nr:hypothetical protein [Thermoanaerobaculia bacterium]
MSNGLLAFTLFHTAISLVAIVAGFVVVWGFIGSRKLKTWTDWFLVTTAATSITGFFFPFHGIKPAHIVGILALLILIPTVLAYRRQMAGHWRWIFVLGSVVSLYLNFFVLIVQAFQKVPALHALAPTQSEPPFQGAQIAALVFFIVLGVLSLRRFRVVAVA